MAIKISRTREEIARDIEMNIEAVYLYKEIIALQFEQEAMRIENKVRISRGETIAYGPECFFELANRCRGIKYDS